MPNGTVKFFNAAKGFGFITSDDASKDVFVPSASVSASGIAALKPGQRVSFEEVPDGKGPKAVNLKLLAEAPKPVPPKMPARTEARPRLTFYHDHTSDWSEYMLEELRAAGHDPLVVSYLETPPTKDELRTLSRLLQAGNQSLVRKYDPLFLELQLDDRFIGESDFWDAIVEHPALINGPLLATGAKAALCHTEGAVDAFFAAPSAESAPPVVKPKGLSERALQMMADLSSAAPAAVAPAVKAAAADVDVLSKAPEPVVQTMTSSEPTALQKAVAKLRPRTVEPAAEPETPAKIAARPKPVAKAKAAPAKAAKAVAKKPAKGR